MGIVLTFAEFMAQAKFQKNLRFNTIITVGHLSSYLSAKEIRALGKKYNKTLNVDVLANEAYVDRFMRDFFEAESVQAIDYSDYQNCDIVHDLNLPIDSKHYEKFDVLIDGGSLEHIFNVPVAVANYMNLLKPGGSLFIWTMANNHMGHGFYQFSPEFFYRVFQPENGFKINSVELVKHPFPGAELSGRATCYAVTDPAQLKRRVGLVTGSPVIIMVHATRTEVIPVLQRYPIQSDYLVAYSNSDQRASQQDNNLINLVKPWIKRYLPQPLQNFLFGLYQLWNNSFFNNKFYIRKRY